MIDPGIYEHVPYHEYAEWPAVRASMLNLVARSLAHARQEEIDPRESTDAQEFGTAFHTAVLEPALFERTFVVAPACDRRYKEGKAIWQQFHANLRPGQEVVTSSDYELMCQIIASVHRDADCAALIEGARYRELSIVWQDDNTGLLCKARLDAISRVGGQTWIVDLKTIQDASRHAFQGAMMRYRWYRSMAWYRHGLNVLRPAPRRCAFLAAEKTPGIPGKVWSLSEQVLDIGLSEIMADLRRYAAARDCGIWPGYGPVEDIELPKWKINEHEQPTEY